MNSSAENSTNTRGSKAANAHESDGFIDEGDKSKYDIEVIKESITNELQVTKILKTARRIDKVTDLATSQLNDQGIIYLYEIQVCVSVFLSVFLSVCYRFSPRRIVRLP